MVHTMNYGLFGPWCAPWSVQLMYISRYFTALFVFLCDFVFCVFACVGLPRFCVFFDELLHQIGGVGVSRNVAAEVLPLAIVRVDGYV